MSKEISAQIFFGIIFLASHIREDRIPSIIYLIFFALTTIVIIWEK